MIFARKINKIPTFYSTFAQNVPEFYITFPEKLFPEIFFLGGGNSLPGAGPRPPPAKSGPVNQSIYLEKHRLPLRQMSIALTTKSLMVLSQIWLM